LVHALRFNGRTVENPGGGRSGGKPNGRSLGGGEPRREGQSAREDVPARD
jgi:hypothetical protein